MENIDCHQNKNTDSFQVNEQITALARELVQK
jgi:hypothetical protein